MSLQLLFLKCLEAIVATINLSKCNANQGHISSRINIQVILTKKKTLKTRALYIVVCIICLLYKHNFCCKILLEASVS